jgi:hypothetical protein
LFEGYDWITVIERSDPADQLYSHTSFAKTVNYAYESVQKICRSRQLEFDFIGKTDAAVILDNDYFERLIEILAYSSNIAFACGIGCLKVSGKVITTPVNRSDKLQGLNDIRLYRRDFFEGIGGYPITPSPDTVLFVKAIQSNWGVEISDKTFFIKTRVGGSQPGIWKGYKLKGQYLFYLGYHPLLAFLLSAYHTIKIPPHYQGMAMFYGFLRSALRRDERIQDGQIIDYFWRIRPKEVLAASFKRKGDGT